MSKQRLYVFDCDFGQSMVAAVDLDSARREAVLDAGRNAGVHNVRLADTDDVAWQRAMGGYVPEIV